MPRDKKKPSGSPASGEPAFLAAGKLRRPHGVRGEAVVELYTDFPERMRSGLEVFLGEAHLPLTIRSVRPHNEGLLLGFEGLDTPEAIGVHRNQLLYIPTDGLPELPSGEYYHHQLLGFQVVDEGGVSLGHLTEILKTGANDVYVVTGPNGRELLLPAIPEVVQGIDRSGKRMKVHLLAGLDPEAASGG